MDNVNGGPMALPDVQRVSLADIGICLKSGWRDFLSAPLFGLFFSAIYVAGGVLMWWVFAAAGQEWWLMPVVVGFPLLAPFAAVGLYEVSRRIEANEKLAWGAVLGVVFSQKDRQIPSIAMVILLMFMFWVFVAHTIFALFMGLSAMTNVTSSLSLLLEGNGPVMLMVGTAIGAAFALVLFSITVAGLPLLVDRDVDFVTAMIVSVQCVLANVGTMLIWGVTIAALLFAGMVPLFLGLFVALPVLGHASWHMYRKLLAG
jgi:uncharacterized membrane protein